MAEKNPDYMLPLDNSDRAEYILVPFSNIIRSINQPICIFMLQHPEEFSLEELLLLFSFFAFSSLLISFKLLSSMVK